MPLSRLRMIVSGPTWPASCSIASARWWHLTATITRSAGARCWPGSTTGSRYRSPFTTTPSRRNRSARGPSATTRSSVPGCASAIRPAYDAPTAPSPMTLMMVTSAPPAPCPRYSPSLLRREVRQALPGDQDTVGQRMGPVHPVPRLRRGDPHHALLDQRDRVAERPLPPRSHRPRPLPDRTGRTEDPLPGRQITRPQRHRASRMGDTLEARPQRVRRHLRRPHAQPRKPLTMRTAVYTAHRTDPRQACLSTRMAASQGVLGPVPKVALGVPPTLT